MTYSIVARDPLHGTFGVAVQSHFFSVGPVVPWARPGVGAVATQSDVRVEYGPQALELLAGGMGASAVLGRLLAADPDAARRQVAVIDGRGGVACHTGAGCIPHAGDVQGDQVTCQANLMTATGVPDAMLEAYQGTSGPLAGRLLAALEAAEAAGGDLRGRQSAALLVVPATGEPWRTEVSLRVEDSPEPLSELRRLLVLHVAYQEIEAAAMAQDPARAVAHGRHALELAPGSAELRFWAAFGLAAGGEVEEAVAGMRELIAQDGCWGELLRRLPDEMSPEVSVLRAALTSADRRQ